MSALVIKSTFVDYVWETMRVSDDVSAMKIDDEPDDLLDTIKTEKEEDENKAFETSQSPTPDVHCMDVDSPVVKSPKSQITKKLKKKSSKKRSATEL